MGTDLGAGLPRAFVWRARARGGGVPSGRGGANWGRGGARPNGGGGDGGSSGGVGVGELGCYRFPRRRPRGTRAAGGGGGAGRRRLAMVGVPGAAAFQRKRGGKAGG